MWDYQMCVKGYEHLTLYKLFLNYLQTFNPPSNEPFNDVTGDLSIFQMFEEKTKF